MKRPFLDTSILVAGLIDFGESSRAAMDLLDRVADRRIPQATTAWHCCLEFYSVATRLPEEFRLSAETAMEFVVEEIMGRLRIHALNAARLEAFFVDAAEQMIRGGRIYDHHIGTIALNGDASVIVTENKKHFLPFVSKGLPVLTAGEFLNVSDPAP
jgi:predicted nucleic acid-binding protein